MPDVEKPLSAAVTQGWEIANYSASIGDSGMLEHCFLLRRQSRHKVLVVRKKALGQGVHAEEVEV